MFGGDEDGGDKSERGEQSHVVGGDEGKKGGSAHFICRCRENEKKARLQQKKKKKITQEERRNRTSREALINTLAIPYFRLRRYVCGFVVLLLHYSFVP